MNTPVGRLLQQLQLTKTEQTNERTCWQGEVGEHSLNMQGRLFGGMVLAQTITAAGRSYPDREVHAVQQTFLRAGTADTPLNLAVHALHLGRTYATVRVELHQGDQLISHAQIGLSNGAGGPDRQDAAPTVTPREQMVDRDQMRGRPNWDQQPVKMLVEEGSVNGTEPNLVTWLRPNGTVPNDPLIHKAVLGFVTDRAIMTVAWRPHQALGATNGATISHSIWFHRPVCLDDWHCHVMRSPTIAAGRGMTHGEIYHDDGTHIATTLQQATYRPPR